MKRPQASWLIFILLSFLAAGTLYGRRPQATAPNPTSRYTLNSSDLAPQIKGFGGPLTLQVEIDQSRLIQSITLIDHSETSLYLTGLDSFLDQFKGRSLREGFALGRNIDAISGATTTSQAVTRIVNKMAREFTAGAPATGLGLDQGFSWPAFWLILLTLSALVLYVFFRTSLFWRRLHLGLVVVILGLIFNISFSSFHLARLLSASWGSWVYLLPLLLGLGLGQFWCGWLCPFGALQELLGVRPRCGQRGPLKRGLRYLKYLLLALFMAALIGGRESLFSWEPLIAFFSRAWSLPEKLVGIVVLFASVFIARGWCRYFCICGAFLSLFNKIALFKRLFPKNYPDCPFGLEGPQDLDCLQCNLCLTPRR